MLRKIAELWLQVFQFNFQNLHNLRARLKNVHAQNKNIKYKNWHLEKEVK